MSLTDTENEIFSRKVKLTNESMMRAMHENAEPFMGLFTYKKDRKTIKDRHDLVELGHMAARVVSHGYEILVAAKKVSLWWDVICWMKDDADDESHLKYHVDKLTKDVLEGQAYMPNGTMPLRNLERVAEFQATQHVLKVLRGKQE